MSIQRILVVDDDDLSRDFLTEAVRELGYRPIATEDPRRALELAGTEHPDLVLSDLRMPEMDGIELTRNLRADHPDLPIVMVTAHGTIESAVQAMKEGASDFLLKPCDAETLELVLERVSRTQRLERENEYLRQEMRERASSEMVAESAEILEVLRSASRIARSKGTVLLTGESGTGKEQIAQYIHQNSKRSEHPFVRVNCAALSEQLLESELFGHEKGAFTGAHKTHYGRFELAHGGTLLLDEIGEISAGMQAKLLRVLQEEEFERVGGQKTLNVDVRVIASTNRELATEVAEGRFREDLYYRLHVLPLHVPPLRERREDMLGDGRLRHVHRQLEPDARAPTVFAIAREDLPLDAEVRVAPLDQLFGVGERKADRPDAGVRISLSRRPRSRLLLPRHLDIPSAPGSLLGAPPPRVPRPASSLAVLVAYSAFSPPAAVHWGENVPTAPASRSGAARASCSEVDAHHLAAVELLHRHALLVEL